MAQICQVLRCHQCLVFQVHQTKKSNKFQCKMCGEKQSIKRHYGFGNGPECRLHVQKLNTIRGKAVEEMSVNIHSDSDIEYEHDVNHKEIKAVSSKWSSFLDNDEIVQEQSEHLYSKDECSENQKNTKKCKGLKQTRHVPYEKLRNKKIFVPPIHNRSVDNENSVSLEENYENTVLVSKINSNLSKDIILEHRNEENSKWSQFIDHQDNVEPIKKNCLNNNDSISNCAKLFELCNDREIDDILNI